jgi:hypothetical protein
MLTSQRLGRRIATIAALAACVAAAPDSAQAQRRPGVSRNPTQLGGALQTINVPVRDRVGWKPPHVRGDRDFKNNGPEIWIRAQFFVENNAIYRRVFMAAVEKMTLQGSLSGGGKTTMSGWSPKKLIWTPPAGMTIVRHHGFREDTVLLHETFNGNAVYERRSPVGRMKIWANADGADVFYTRVMIDFDYTLPVVVQRGAFHLVTAHLPRTIEFAPPHTRGDRDFKSHGPKVNITAYVMHTSKQVVFVIDMKAQETKSDWTTGEGKHAEVIYTAPAGKRIKALNGKTMWRDVVNYTDTDHEMDKFSDPVLGDIHVWGDTLANDVPYETRVVFSNIRHSVGVVLENQ